MADDYYTYLQGIARGGAAARGDSITGLNSKLAQPLYTMMMAAPPEIRSQLFISSGYRSPATQQVLWNQALQKYGSAAAARRWVAPPGKSEHGDGLAADLQFGSPAAMKWAHDNAAQYGLNFPLSNENWHIEPLGIRGDASQGAGLSAPAVPGTAPTVPGTTLASAPAGTPAAAAPSASPVLGALSKIAQGLSPKVVDPSANQIIPPSLDTAGSSGAAGGAGSPGTAAAGALMAQLINDRRNQYGLSLTGMSPNG